LLFQFLEDTRPRWGSQLATLDVSAGAMLQTMGEPVRNVYFPLDLVVGQFHEAAPGQSMAVLLIGPGGIVGISGVLSHSKASHDNVALTRGRVLRLGLDHLRSAMDQDSATRHLVFSAVQSQMVQLAQAATCSRFHSVEQQLCTRLWQLLDEGPANEVSLTQALLARSVGARRERVNAIVGELQRAGVVESSRGRLRLLDPAGLTERSCECRPVLAWQGQREPRSSSGD